MDKAWHEDDRHMVGRKKGFHDFQNGADFRPFFGLFVFEVNVSKSAHVDLSVKTASRLVRLSRLVVHWTTALHIIHQMQATKPYCNTTMCAKSTLVLMSTGILLIARGPCHSIRNMISCWRPLRMRQTRAYVKPELMPDCVILVKPYKKSWSPMKSNWMEKPIQVSWRPFLYNFFAAS